MKAKTRTLLRGRRARAEREEIRGHLSFLASGGRLTILAVSTDDPVPAAIPVLAGKGARA